MAFTTTLGVNNLLTSATVTASTDTANAANMWEGFLGDFWTAGTGAQTLVIDHGSAKAIDYWGIAGHNLGSDGASAAIAWSDDNISYTTIETLNPTTDAVIFSTFTSVSHRYTKVTVTGVTSAKIARLHVGTTDDLSGVLAAPFTQPELAAEYQFTTPISQGGLPLGRSVKHTSYEFDMVFNTVATSWVEANWLALYAQIAVSPFFLLWDATNHSTDTAFAWLQRNAKPNYSDPLYHTYTLRCRGVV